MIFIVARIPAYLHAVKVAEASATVTDFRISLRTLSEADSNPNTKELTTSPHVTRPL